MNRNGERVAIVHQYDRDEELMQHYIDDFVNFPPPEPKQGKDKCSGYELHADVELFKGICDMSEGSTTAQQCCEKCSKSPSCKGWTLSSHLCFFKNCHAPKRSTGKRIPGALCASKEAGA